MNDQKKTSMGKIFASFLAAQVIFVIGVFIVAQSDVSGRLALLVILGFFSVLLLPFTIGTGITYFSGRSAEE